MRKILLILLLIISTAGAFAQRGPIDKARGLFVAFAVGPRLPVGYFSNSTDLGYAFNVEISYTDNEYIPFFIFAKIGSINFRGPSSFTRFPITQTYQPTFCRSASAHDIISLRWLRTSCCLCLLLKSRPITFTFKDFTSSSFLQEKAITPKIYPKWDFPSVRACLCS